MHLTRRISTVLPEPLKDGRPIRTAESEARDSQMWLYREEMRGDKRASDTIETTIVGVRTNKEWSSLELYCTIR